MNRTHSALALTLLLAACSRPVPVQVVTPVPLTPSAAPTVAASPAAPTAAPPTDSAPGTPAPPTAAVEPAGAVAPGVPLAADTWTPGIKLGVGTAYTYDQPPGASNPSRVWFGITAGAITEGLYPDVTRANLKLLSLIVTDGRTFVADEMLDADHTVERLEGGAPAFRVRSTDRQGRWAVVKEVVADPQADTILFTVRFQALRGVPGDYRLFLQYAPRVGNSGAGDAARAAAGVVEAWDEGVGIFTALVTDPPPALATVGYTGVSDLPSDLRGDFDVDATYAAVGEPGRVTTAIELPAGGASTVALGFGASRAAARGAAESSLRRGFGAVAQEYVAGWRAYLDSLAHPYPSLPLYDESAAAIKTHADKTYPGAGVASLAVPWGQHRDDADPRERGYRYVWPRDLYHVAMAMLVMGDEAGARATLAYLDDVLQREDGSFPQNAFLDGTPKWQSIQLDEVADPIILAWHLRATDRYESLVRPAADFILKLGPRTPQERWEEIAGYSPATLAAEVAALVCAADLAAQAGDAASAERYLRAADEWNSSIEAWTLTTSGPLSAKPYYLRITATGDPNSATPIEIANGGGFRDPRTIVDQSFLELVRRGLRSPDDPHVVSTLEVVDAILKVVTPKGPVYARYPHDGYGESAPGLMPDGHGQYWPLLLGERGVYDVALTRSEHPASWWLPVMASFANQGGMLPEQVFADGSGTGSATPLAWAHAEYIVFAHAVKCGCVPDRPAVVAARYIR
ncbi:MAG TPA: glycoside hydrolase family 15 protein [Roseiflexaceae bacterium]|nr:glycoside hydrolase family 15 protein [Roseiflexaceae bacterium]